MASQMMNAWGQLPAKAFQMLLSYLQTPKSPKITHITKIFATEKVVRGHTITKVIKSVSTDLVLHQPSHVALLPPTKCVPMSRSTSNGLEVSSFARTIDWSPIVLVVLPIFLFALVGFLLRFRSGNVGSGDPGNDIPTKDDVDTHPINACSDSPEAVGDVHTGPFDNSSPAAATSGGHPEPHFRVTMMRALHSVRLPLFYLLLGATICYIIMKVLHGPPDAPVGPSDVSRRNEDSFQSSPYIFTPTIREALLGLINVWTFTMVLTAFVFLARPSEEIVERLQTVFACLRDLSGRIILSACSNLATFIPVAWKWSSPTLARFGRICWSIDIPGTAKFLAILTCKALKSSALAIINISQHSRLAQVQKEFDAFREGEASVRSEHLAQMSRDKIAFEVKDEEMFHLKEYNTELENAIQSDYKIHDYNVQQIKQKAIAWIQEAQDKEKKGAELGRENKRKWSEALNQVMNRIKELEDELEARKAGQHVEPCKDCEKSSQITLMLQHGKAIADGMLEETRTNLVVKSTEYTELKTRYDEHVKKSHENSKRGCEKCAKSEALMNKADQIHSALQTDHALLRSQATESQQRAAESQKIASELQERCNNQFTQLQEVTKKRDEYKKELDGTTIQLLNLTFEHSSCQKSIEEMQCEKEKAENEKKQLQNEIIKTRKSVVSSAESWRHASKAAYHAAFPHGHALQPCILEPSREQLMAMGFEALRVSLGLQYGIKVNTSDFQSICGRERVRSKLASMKEDKEDPQYNANQLACVLELWSKNPRKPLRLGFMSQLPGVTGYRYTTHGSPDAEQTVWIYGQHGRETEWMLYTGLGLKTPGKDPPGDGT